MSECRYNVERVLSKREVQRTDYLVSSFDCPAEKANAKWTVTRYL